MKVQVMLEHCTLFPMCVIEVKGRRFGEKKCLTTKLTTFRNFNDNRVTSIHPTEASFNLHCPAVNLLILAIAQYREKLRCVGPNT